MNFSLLMSREGWDLISPEGWDGITSITQEGWDD